MAPRNDAGRFASAAPMTLAAARELGARCRATMRALGLTATEAAELLADGDGGPRPSTICCWLRGARMQRGRLAPAPAPPWFVEQLDRWAAAPAGLVQLRRDLACRSNAP